jgi:hypothetical protein
MGREEPEIVTAFVFFARLRLWSLPKLPKESSEEFAISRKLSLPQGLKPQILLAIYVRPKGRTLQKPLIQRLPGVPSLKFAA